MDQNKYDKLILDLENLIRTYETTDYIWLKGQNRTFLYGSKNHQFHYFIYCIDWSEIYGNSINRLTIYDIIVSASGSGIKKLKIFSKVYNQLKKLFDGNIANAIDIKECKEMILNKLSEGLNSLGSVGHKSRGLNEFFKMLLEKIGSVEYETSDFSAPYLLGDLQQSRSIIDIYDKFVPAFKVAIEFNKIFLPLFKGVIISPFFALHVLLRHTVTFKFKYNFFPDQNSSNNILDGTGRNVPITVHSNQTGDSIVISQDGEFFPPDFSTNEEDYINFKIQGGILLGKEKEIAKKLYEKLNGVLPLFLTNFSSTESPNIIYFEKMFYGFEFPIWSFKQSGIIELESFYPLNSEIQKKNGISRKEFDQITNKGDIPSDFSIKVAPWTFDEFFTLIQSSLFGLRFKEPSDDCWSRLWFVFQ